MTRQRDIQRRFLETQNWRPTFTRNGWMWRRNGIKGTFTRDEAFEAEYRSTDISTRRELKARLTQAV